ncbi:hypothetical protein [Roseospirillum parvum]|uniref:Uncharacterized protein n=1 Tax=Roseospirillum parvum TaxID=83401 RepID=A0A1G8B692_9PROT|nr:hypothetical protein [Roseospirillum parvum]SDH28665.1 hypothetical protein SAMN05421742_105236 [Roseospirillum parvum]
MEGTLYPFMIMKVVIVVVALGWFIAQAIHYGRESERISKEREQE